MAKVVYVKSARVRVDKETGQPKPLNTCDKCTRATGVTDLRGVDKVSVSRATR